VEQGWSHVTGQPAGPLRSCNLRKGNREQKIAEVRFESEALAPGSGEPRKWQRAAMGVVMDRILSEPVLVEACPGAGKTQFGLEVAYELVKSNAISRVLVVVPTLGIADGWNMAASLAVPRSPTLPLRSQRDW
jgi:superfamily II DNA or RNA helicase